MDRRQIFWKASEKRLGTSVRPFALSPSKGPSLDPFAFQTYAGRNHCPVVPLTRLSGAAGTQAVRIDRLKNAEPLVKARANAL